MQFPCHKVVLAAVSEYFHSLFTSSLRKECIKITTLENIHCRTFEVVLDYAYSGVLNITPDNAYALLKSGDFLGMNKLVDRCVDYVTNTSNVGNILKILMYLIHPMKKFSFARKVAKNIAEKFEEVEKVDDFVRIPFCALSMIIEEIPIKFSKPNCDSCGHNFQQYHSFREDKTFTCSSCGRKCPPRLEPRSILPYLFKWMNYDIFERKKHFRDLAVLLQLPDDYIEGCESTMECLESQLMEKLIRSRSTLRKWRKGYQIPLRYRYCK